MFWLFLIVVDFLAIEREVVQTDDLHLESGESLGKRDIICFPFQFFIYLYTVHNKCNMIFNPFNN